MNARVETFVRNIRGASTRLVDTDAVVSQVSSYIAENAEVSLNLELSLWWFLHSFVGDSFKNIKSEFCLIPELAIISAF